MSSRSRSAGVADFSATREQTVRNIFQYGAYYGVCVLMPLWFIELPIMAPMASLMLGGKPVDHQSLLYSFIGLALTFQYVYWLCGSDPLRYRAFMPTTVLAKMSVFMPITVLFFQGKIEPLAWSLSFIDGALGVAFAWAYLVTPKVDGTRKAQ
jgi:hypothetical protein